MSVAVSEKSKTEQFSERTLQIINHAALALMMSIGHRTRPVRHDGGPAARRSAAQIATPAQLNERYVREWLGAMVTGGIVEYDAGRGLVPFAAGARRVPDAGGEPEQRRRDDAVGAVLGAAEDAVVEAFHHGRGVPYSAYPRFHAVMAEESRQTVVEGLLQPHPAARHRGSPTSSARGSTCSTSRAEAAGAVCRWRRRFRRAASPASTCRRRRLPPAAPKSRRASCATSRLVQADAAELWLDGDLST